MESALLGGATTAITPTVETITTHKTREVIGQKINRHAERKKQFNLSADPEYCRNRIQRYIKKATAKQIPLPYTLALDPYPG